MPPQSTTAEVVISKQKDEIIREAKRIEESALYSSKGHFAAASIWRMIHFCIGLPATVLAAIAAAAAFSEFDSGHRLGGWISIGVAALSALATFLNPNERAAAHLEAANSFGSLQDRARIFWTIDCWAGDSDSTLNRRLKDFVEEKSESNRKSSQIFRLAYWIAKRGIAAGEADYKVDKPTK